MVSVLDEQNYKLPELFSKYGMLLVFKAYIGYIDNYTLTIKSEMNILW